MANELLDFVMSLVRDPEAAARYAADPSAAIADANLTGVTSADVANLIPMVSDSLSMAAPGFGGQDATDANVWTSGAATAAFDSFEPHAIAEVHDLSGGVIDASAPPTSDSAPLPEFSQLNDLIADHSAAVLDSANEVVTEGPAVWDDAVQDTYSHDAAHDHPGFDLFD